MSLLHPMIRDEEGKRFGLAFTSPFEQLGKGTERGRRLREAGWKIQRAPTRREWMRIVCYIPFILPIVLAVGLGPLMITRQGLPLWAMPFAILPMALAPVTVTVTMM